MEYPKWLYHRTHDPVIVNDPDEHTALGRGWTEEPHPDDIHRDEAEDYRIRHGDPEELQVPGTVKPKAKKNAHR